MAFNRLTPGNRPNFAVQSPWAASKGSDASSVTTGAAFPFVSLRAFAASREIPLPP